MQNRTSAKCISTLTAGSIVPKSIYDPGGTWVSWDDTTISALGATVIGVTAVGYNFASSTSSSLSLQLPPTPSLPSPSPATTVLITPTSSQTATTISSNPTDALAKGYNSGLSTGAKAGIAVGCIVAALALAALLIFLSPKYRRRQKGIPLNYHEKDGSNPISELIAEYANYYEKDGNPISELRAGNENYHETDGNPISELRAESADGSPGVARPGGGEESASHPMAAY